MSRPVFDIAAEQAVLAVLALKPDVADEVSARLPEPECFHDRGHQALFTALLNLARRREPADQVTTAAELARTGGLAAFRNRRQAEEYVLQICQQVPTARHIDAYIGIVRRLWMLRRAQFAAAAIADSAGLPQSEVDALLVQMQQQAVALMGHADQRPTALFKDVAERVLEDEVDRLEEASRLAEGLAPGLPSGVPGLSELIGGLRPGSFWIFAGAPGGGKSTLMMQIAEHVAATAAGRLGADRGGALVVTLEMSPAELARKTLLAHARIDSRIFDDGRAEQDHVSALAEWQVKLATRRLLFDDLPAPTWPQVRARITMAHDRWGIEAVFIDYLQKIRKDDRRQDKKDQVREIAEGCKALARELNIVVAGMAQLKRPQGRGKPGRPSMHDLAESANLEREADGIVLLSASEAVTDRPESWETGIVRERITLIVAKNRGGVSGDVKMIFNKTHGRFEPEPGVAERTWHNALPYKETD